MIANLFISFYFALLHSILIFWFIFMYSDNWLFTLLHFTLLNFTLLCCTLLHFIPLFFLLFYIYFYFFIFFCVARCVERHTNTHDGGCSTYFLLRSTQSMGKNTGDWLTDWSVKIHHVLTCDLIITIILFTLIL